MFGSHVTFADYEGVEGFGSVSTREIFDLQKALRAGASLTIPGTPVPGDGFTLKPESLEQTLYNVSFRMEHIQFWKGIDKIPAYNTVEEYSRLREYGNGLAAFIQEGELPPEDDATYSREFDVVKFLGTTRRVTHVMQTVRSHIGDVIAQETINGTMWLLERVERGLFYGDDSLVPEEFNGIFTLLQRLLPSENVVDMRGQPLSQDSIEEGAHIVRAAPNYGIPTDLWMSDGAYSDLARSFYPTQRSALPPSQDGTVGFVVEKMRTQAGLVRFNSDVFIQPGRAPVAAGVGDVSKRPAPPSVGVAAAVALGGGEVSFFAAADAGSYRYKVAARNRFGISVPVDVNAGAAIAVAANEKVTIPISNNSPAATAYILYRSDRNGALIDAKEFMQVAATSGTVTATDFNAELPGTTKACLLQQNRENLVIKQLAPFTRIPLATVDLSTRWAQVIYLALTLHSPRKNVLFKNIGRIAGTRSPLL
jgi:hypothetical protein